MPLMHCSECGHVFRDLEHCPTCQQELTSLRKVIVCATCVFVVAVICIGLMAYTSQPH